MNKISRQQLNCPKSPKPQHPQPSFGRKYGSGVTVGIILNIVALFAIISILSVLMTGCFGKNDNAQELDFDPESSFEEQELESDTQPDSDTNGERGLGRYYYPSADMPRQDIIEQATSIIFDMMLPDGDTLLHYEATPEMIYSDIRLQEGVLWFCYWRSDMSEDYTVSKQDMDQRAMRMFGVELSKFSSSLMYVPYYKPELDAYDMPNVGKYGGYFCDEDSIELWVEDEKVFLRARIYEEVESEMVDGHFALKEDRGTKQLGFSIGNDNGVYFLHFEHVYPA